MPTLVLGTYHLLDLYKRLSYVTSFPFCRCGGLVFDAEKQVAKSGAYHKKCFTCVKCKHQLDATNFANGPDNEVYCVYCYRVRLQLQNTLWKVNYSNFYFVKGHPRTQSHFQVYAIGYNLYYGRRSGQIKVSPLQWKSFCRGKNGGSFWMVPSSLLSLQPLQPAFGFHISLRRTRWQNLLSRLLRQTSVNISFSFFHRQKSQASIP